MTVDEAWEEKWFRDAVHAWGCAIMVMGKNLGRLVVCIVHEFDVEAQVCVGWILGDTKISNSHPGDLDFSYFLFCQMLIERNQQDE